MQLDAEAALKLVAQIHPPPAYHPVADRIGAGLHPGGEFGGLLGRQF